MNDRVVPHRCIRQSVTHQTLTWQRVVAMPNVLYTKSTAR